MMEIRSQRRKPGIRLSFVKRFAPETHRRQSQDGGESSVDRTFLPVLSDLRSKVCE